MTCRELIRALMLMDMDMVVSVDTDMNLGPPAKATTVTVIHPTREAREYERQNPQLREIIHDPERPSHIVILGSLL